MASMCVRAVPAPATRRAALGGGARSSGPSRRAPTRDVRRIRPPSVRCSAASDESSDDDPTLGRREAMRVGVIFSALVYHGGIFSMGLLPVGRADAAALSGVGDGPVLVVGATGATGRRIVAQLRAKGVAVRAGSRDVKKAQVGWARTCHLPVFAVFNCWTPRQPSPSHLSLPARHIHHFFRRALAWQPAVRNWYSWMC